MAQPFNLTAQLNVTGPVGLRPVVNTIRKQLAGINTNVNVQISQQSARHVKNLNSQILALNKSLQAANGSAASLNAQMASLGKSISNLGGSSGKASKGLSNVANNANQTAAQLKVASTQMQEFGRISGLALRRYAGFTVATTITFGFVRAVSDAVSEAIKFDRELVKISQVTGRSMNSLKGLTTEIGRLSTGLGVSSTELLEVSRILAQTGMRASEVRRSLDALAKSTLAPTFNDIKNTAEGAVAAMAQFKIGARDLEKVLGSINAVAGKFAVESEDLISVIRRTGGVFKAAAGDIGTPINQLNELIAIFTSVRSTTRESADSIAVGLRTIFSRIQRPRTIQFLKQFGVELNDLNGKFVGPFEAMKKLSQAFKDLDTRDVRFAKIVEELGGFRQVGKLIPAITQFAKAQDALRVAQQGQGSLARDAQKAQQALAVQISKTREEFSRLIREFSETDSFRLVAKTALEIANSMIRLADSLKPVLPLITAVTAVKGLGALRQFGSGFFGGIRQAGGAGAVGAGLAGAATGQGAAQAAKTTATSNRQLSSVLNNVAKQMTANTTATSQASKNLITSQQNLTNKLGSLTLAIGNLTRVISMQTPFRVGGGGGGGRRPTGFASGGMVPGTGNYDNYPAMLTPGEFVVRKSAVKQIGEGYLNSVNRYASGGRVVKSRSGYGPRDIFRGAKRQRGALQQEMGGLQATTGKNVDFIIKEPPNYGAFYFTKTRTASEKPKTGKASIAFSKISKEKQSQLATLAGASSSDLIKSKVIGFPEAYFPRASVGKKFRGATKKGLKSMVDTVVQKALQLKPQGFVNSLPADERPSISSFYNQVKKGIGFESIEGKMWEAFLGAFGNQISNDTRGTWDFPGVKGKGALSKVFGRGVMTLNHADAKRTYSQSMIASVIDKAVNNKVAPLSPIIPTQQATARDIESRFKGMSAFGGKKQGIQLQRGSAMRRFASGGSVSDTVPALLTPGEFVINRRAASSIGLGNLTKMNRGEVPGYASGGLVTASRGGYGPGNRGWFEQLRRDRRARALRNQRAQQQGMGGGGGGRMQGMGGQAGMGLLFGAPMIGQMIAGDTPLQDRSLGSVRTSEAITQGGALGGTAAMLGGGPFVAVTAGLIGVANGAMEAEQKLKEAIASDELQQASKGVQEVFEKFTQGAATMAELATSLQDMNNAARRREGVLADPAMNLTGLIARGAGGDAASAGLIQQAGIMATLVASLTDLVGMTEDAQKKLFDQTVDAGIFSQLERAQAQADEISPIFNKLISDSYDVGKSWQENMAKLRGNDAFNQAVEVMARADAQVGKSIAAFEQHAARTGQDMSASINTLILDWANTTGKAMVDQIRIAKELEDAAKKSTIALDMVITRMQAMSAVSSRASSAMDDARRINTMQVETRLGQPKFQASNRFSNVFGNIRGFSSNEVSDTLNALETRIGSGAASSAVFQEARRGTEISVQARELIPQIIQTLPVGSDVNQLRAEMEKGVLAGAPQATKDMFDKIFTEIEAMGAQSKDKSLAEIAQSPEIMEKINAAGEASAKAIQDLAKAVDKEAQAMAKELNKLTKMILDTSQKFEDVNQIRFQQQAQMADIEGRELTLRESFAPIESQIKSLTSISGGPNAGTMDPQMIGNRLILLRQQREQARKDVDAGLPGAAEKVSELDAAITGAAKALELLKTNTTRQAAIVEKINRLEQIRSGAKNMVEAFMVGDVEAQRKFGMQAQALNMFQGAAARGQEQQFMAQANPMVRQLLLEGIRGDMGNMLAPEARKKLEDQMFGGFMGAMGVDRDHALNRAVMGEGFGGLDRGDLIGQLHEVNQQQLEAARQLAGMASGAEQQQRDFLNKAAQLFAQELEKHLNRITGTGIIKKNAGGTIPGTGSSDTVRAMLTPGEFVINKAATAQNLPLLRDINKHGATQKFAKGGMVQGRGKIHRFRDGGAVPEEEYPNLDGQWAILRPYDSDKNNKLSQAEYDKWYNSFEDPIAQAASRTVFGSYRNSQQAPEEAIIKLGLIPEQPQQIIAETEAAVEAHGEVVGEAMDIGDIALRGTAAVGGALMAKKIYGSAKDFKGVRGRFAWKKFAAKHGLNISRAEYLKLQPAEQTALTQEKVKADNAAAAEVEAKTAAAADAEAKAADAQAKAADAEAKASRTTAPDRIDPLAPTGPADLNDPAIRATIEADAPRAASLKAAADAKAAELKRLESIRLQQQRAQALDIPRPDTVAPLETGATARDLSDLNRPTHAPTPTVTGAAANLAPTEPRPILPPLEDPEITDFKARQQALEAEKLKKARARELQERHNAAERARSAEAQAKSQAEFERLQNSSATAQGKISANRQNYQRALNERNRLVELQRSGPIQAGRSGVGIYEFGEKIPQRIAALDAEIARSQAEFQRLQNIQSNINSAKSNAALDVEMNKAGTRVGLKPGPPAEGLPKINTNITGKQMASVGKFRKAMRGLGKTLPVVGTGFDIYAVGAGIYHKDPMMISRALNDVGLDIASFGVKPTLELSTELGRWGMQGAGWAGEKLGLSDGSLREAYSLDEGEEGTLDAYWKRGMEIAHRAALIEQSESDMSLRGASQARVLDKYRRMGVDGKTKLSKEFMQVVGKMSAQNYIKYLSPKWRPKPISDSQNAGHGLDATTYTPAGGESSGWAGAKLPLPAWLGGRLGDFFEEFKYDWDADEFFNTFLAVGDENSKKTFDITGGGAIQSRSALNEAISNPDLLKPSHKRDLEIDKDLRDKWTAYGRMPTRDWVSKVTANKGHQALSEIIYNSMLAQRDLMYDFPGAFGFKEVQGKIGGRVRQNMAWWEQQNELFTGFDTLNSRKLEEKQKEIVDNYAMSVTEAGRFKTGGTWPLNSEPALKGSAQELPRVAALSQTMSEWMLKMPSDGSPTRRPWQRITKAQEEGFDWSTAEYEPVGETKVENFHLQEWARLYKNGQNLTGGPNDLMPFSGWDSSNPYLGFDVSKLKQYKSWHFRYGVNSGISKKFSKRAFWEEALSRHSIGGLTLPFSLVDGGGASGWPLNLSGHKSGSKIAGMTTPLYFNTARMGIGFNEVASRIEDEYLNAQTRIGQGASRALMEAAPSEREYANEMGIREVSAGVPVKDLAADAIGPISADLLTNAFKEISTMMSVWGSSNASRALSAGEYPVISGLQEGASHTYYKKAGNLIKTLSSASGWMVEGAKSPYETLSRLVTGMSTEKYKSFVDEFNYPSRDFYDSLVGAGTGLYDSVYPDWEKARREGKTISGAMGNLPSHASTGHLPSHFAYTPAFFGVKSFDNIPNSAYSNPAAFAEKQGETLKNMRNWLIDNYRHHQGTVTTPNGEKRSLNMYFPMIEGTRNLDEQQLRALHGELTADPDIKAAQILGLIQKHGGNLGIDNLGNVYKKNSGGRIPGYGTSDTVPAMLTPGEFVINASSAQSNMGLLHAINSGSLRGYNAGGVVRRFQEGGEAKEDKKGSFSMPSNETLANMLLDWGYGRHNVKSFYEPQWWAKTNAETYKRYGFHPDDSIWMNSGEQSADRLNGNLARWLSADFMEVKGIATAAGDRPIRSFSDVHSFSFTRDDRFNKPLKYTPTKNPLEYLKKILGSDDIDKWADRHYIFPPHFDEHVARQALHKLASDNYDSVGNELKRMREWSDNLWEHYAEIDRSWVLSDGQTKEEIEKNRRAQYENTKTGGTEIRTLDDTGVALAKMRIDMKNGVIPKPPVKKENPPEGVPRGPGQEDLKPAGDNGAPAAEKPKPRTLSDEQGQLHQESQQWAEDYNLGGDKGAYFAALAMESAPGEYDDTTGIQAGRNTSGYLDSYSDAKRGDQESPGTSFAKQGPWKKKKKGGGELATVKDVTVTEAMTENKKGYTTSNYGMRRFRFLGPDKEGWRPQDGQTPFSLNQAGELEGSHIKAGEVYDFEKETARKDSQLKVPAKWGMPSGKRVNNMGAYLDLLYSYAGKFGATFTEMQKPDFAPNEGFSKEWMHMLDFIKEGPAVGKKIKDTIIKAEKEGGGGAVIRAGLDNPGMAIGGPLAELAKEANFTPLRLSVPMGEDDISTAGQFAGAGQHGFVNSVYSLLDMASNPTAIKSGDLYIDEGQVWSKAKKQFKSKGPYAIAGFTREPSQFAISMAQGALELLADAIYPAMSFKDWNSDIMSKEAILGKMANAGITNNHPSFQEASAIAELYDQWNGAYANNSDENDWAAAHSHFYRKFYQNLPKEYRDNLMGRALPLIQAAHERGREKQNRLNTLLTTAGAQKPRQVSPNLKFNKGGFLARYKYGGQAGVDSIPAMLTPGEFVINADAASKNLGLLERINSGSPPQGYNNGGRVQRFQKGGRGESRRSVTVGGGELAAAIAAFNQTSAPKLATAMMTFNTSANNLAGALTSFGTTAGQLAQAIKSLETMNIPERITLDMADSTVTLTGESSLATALSNAIGGRLGSIIAEAVSALTGTNVDGSPTGQER